MEPTDKGGRFASLDLCPWCLKGDITPRLVHRGFGFEQKRREQVIRNQNGSTSTIYYLELTGFIPGEPLGIEATFSRETIGTSLIKLFKKELQVGDPLFDDNIYISTPDKEGLAPFLRHEGMQTAIMECLELDKAKFKIVDAPNVMCAVHFSQSGNYTPAILESRIIAAMLHYIELTAQQK